MSYTVTFELADELVVSLPKSLHGVRKSQTVDSAKLFANDNIGPYLVDYALGVIFTRTQAVGKGEKAPGISAIDDRLAKLYAGQTSGGRESDPVGVRARVILNTLVADKLGSSRTEKNKVEFDALFMKTRNDATKWAKLVARAEADMKAAAELEIEL